MTTIDIPAALALAADAEARAALLGQPHYSRLEPGTVVSDLRQLAAAVRDLASALTQAREQRDAAKVLELQADDELRRALSERDAAYGAIQVSHQQREELVKMYDALDDDLAQAREQRDAHSIANVELAQKWSTEFERADTAEAELARIRAALTMVTERRWPKWYGEFEREAVFCRGFVESLLKSMSPAPALAADDKRAEAGAETLRAACQKLVDYARRNRNNWQTEKALDYIRLIDAALAPTETPNAQA